MNLSDEKKGLVVKMLASKPLYETGVEFGFDKHYSTTIAVKNAVYRIYQQVKKDPEKYLVNPEALEVIAGIVNSRALSKTNKTTLKEKQEAVEKSDLKTILLDMRRKSLVLLDAKLERIGSSRKRLDEVPITSLAQAAGIIFDKTQIIQGEATENVALLAKIDTKMSPAEAISTLLKMREFNQIEKTTKKK